VAALLGLVAVLVGSTAAVRSVTDRRARRCLDKYRDKWVDTREFDEPANAIWRTVEFAVSEAERATAASNVVDGAEAQVLLADQRWGIARELAAQSRLRRDGAMDDARASRDLATAVVSSRRRAGAVAAYARQLTALAAAASAPRREAEAARLRDRARELVAAAAGDELFVGWLRDASERARRLTRALSPDTGARLVTRWIARRLRQIARAPQP